ncbi:2-oxoglutarate (2OG) and Fe(II)-dependent oxygenase superfamily protein [Euphorbia peplus]|nr:2-oxoglutarate (2OG) and Fe(II)-dependent oxygenase superfamily protein [Euphorbia peplus]
MESSKKNETTSIGSSLLVPCVQELAKEASICVPHRYIRPDFQPNVPDHDQHHHEVPIIDFQRLLHPHSMDSELENLHFASKHWGFFQLVNHGVSSSLLDQMKNQVQDFFNLPMEEKKKFWQYPGEIEGFGQAFVVSDEQKLDWGDLFFMLTHPVHMRKPHLFPNLPLPFRDTLENYSLEVKNLAVAILDHMAKALKIKPEEMREFSDGIRQTMRMNYYPPCPQPEKVIGLTPHSDGTGLTILLQVNDVEGLQIQKDGKWVAIKPLPNAFVVNIGDILEIITNGTYRSILHRATVNSEKERLSIASFHSPRYDGEIRPAPSLITDETPALYRRLTVQDFFKGLFSRELRAKSYVDTLKIQDSESNCN